MNLTQNEKISQVKEDTIVIGVDIASEVHYARAFDWRGIELGKVTSFENSEEGFKNCLRWIDELKVRYGKKAVLTGAEPTGHYWFSLAVYFKKQNMKMVLVNPYHVKQSKELDDNHPSKTDRKDPKTIAKLVIEGRYNEPYIPEGIYADLRVAMTFRWRILKEQTSIENQIQRWLKIYFPEYKEVFDSFDCISSMIILRKAPLPSDIIVLGADGVNALWREAKIRAVGKKRAEQLYEAAKRTVGCSEGKETAKMELILCAVALIYGGVVDYTRREIPDFVHIIMIFSRILIGFSVLYGIMCLVIPAVLLIAAAKISKSRLAGGDFKLLCGLGFACGLP
jgi:transposase